jgi:hypothetical protein
MHIILTYLPFKRCRFCRVVRFRFRLLFLFILFAGKVFSQDQTDYEEVMLILSVPRIGNTEIPALIKEDEAWIGLKEVFEYLKIKNKQSSNFDTISGFFIDPDSRYIISKPGQRILYKENVYDLKATDLIETKTGLFLRPDVLFKVFGLDFQFSYRNLSITLKTKIDLPAFRDMQQDQLRKNLSKLKGEKKADSVLKRRFSFFHLGMADWSVTATQVNNNANYLRAGLTLGAVLAGGEATVNLNYLKGQRFDPSKQLYRWRYVDNGLSVIKQISVGNFTTPTISSIISPLMGIQITNAPTTSRKTFGSYRYTGTTQQGWTVELYVNNILVDYVKADVSGIFTFEIPIVYGNSLMRLKFYGPWGEENMREEFIAIPYNFLPVKKLEYTISGGVLQVDTHKQFGRVSINYGVNRRYTIGAGAEYLSSVLRNKPLLFVNNSIRIFDGIIINGEYSHGVRTKVSINYNRSSGLQTELSYTNYNKEQKAVRSNNIAERKASITLPIQLKNLKLFSRFTFKQSELQSYRYITTDLLLSACIHNVNANLRTFVQINEFAKPYEYSNISLSFQLSNSIRFAPQVQYQYDKKIFNLLKLEAETKISNKGYMNLSYECNRYLQNNSLTVSLRYDLSYLRTFFSVSRSNKAINATQSASGSIVYENKAHFARADKQASVGTGGFLVIAFLDLNCNGFRDFNEPRIDGLHLKINEGRIDHMNDSSLLITNLEGYKSYIIEMDSKSFDNIAWQINMTTIKATAEPNRVIVLQVPVAVVGEVSGIVYLKSNGKQKGLSRIIINFYSNENKIIAHTLTEGDGYFNLLGLKPGQYTAQLDTAQLNILKLRSAPQQLFIDIATKEDGTVADGFEFLLTPVSDSGEVERVIGINQQGADNNNLKINSAANNPFKKSNHESPVLINDTSATANNNFTEMSSVKSSLKEKDLYSKETGKTYKTILEKNPSVKTNKSAPSGARYVKKKIPARVNTTPARKQQILIQQKVLNKREKDVFFQLEKLIKEQAELVKKQRDLIKEIRKLKLRSKAV